MMKRITMWLLVLLVGMTSLAAQEYMFRGEVQDQTGEPLIGASVKALNSGFGVITDIDGKFALKVKNGDQVEFSYVGCISQTITITGQNDVKIVLSENTEALDEVVVVGYGTMKKKDLTGAVVAIDP